MFVVYTVAIPQSIISGDIAAFVVGVEMVVLQCVSFGTLPEHADDDVE